MLAAVQVTLVEGAPTAGAGLRQLSVALLNSGPEVGKRLGVLAFSLAQPGQVFRRIAPLHVRQPGVTRLQLLDHVVGVLPGVLKAFLKLTSFLGAIKIEEGICLQYVGAA